MLTITKCLDMPCGQAYLLHTHDGFPLEAGDVFMSKENKLGTRPYHFEDFKFPSDYNKRVMTLSTLAGCPMSCTFCASSNTFKRKLTEEEILQQVELMCSSGLQKGRAASLSETNEFRILLTRMGEPLLNTPNIIEACRALIRSYPRIIIGLSTSGIKKGLDELLAAKDILPHIELQFSLHATLDPERNTLFACQTGLDILAIDEISPYVSQFYEFTKRPVSLNFILFKGFTYDFVQLIQHFNIDQIWLRLSPWNEVAELKSKYGYQGLIQTIDVEQKSPVSSNELSQIIHTIEKVGLSYAFAPAIDEEIRHNVACGQALLHFNQDVLPLNVKHEERLPENIDLHSCL